MKIQTDKDFYKDDGVNFIRSSALKSFESCSWLYYCDYVLKLPHTSNKGAMMGNVCHSFFECLLKSKPKRKQLFNKIIKSGSIFKIESAKRLVLRFIKSQNLPEDKETLELIDNMILVGLKSDFYIKDGKIIGNEFRFKIQNENPKYSIYGTIDKVVVKNKTLMIDDFKSSKKKYEDEEISGNIQALMYSLAAKKTWPELKPSLRFIFLQFPEDPYIKIEYNDNILKGFEEYLAAIQTKIDNFTLADAKNNFAADKERGKNTFTGSLLCGYSKYPGHLNREGKPYWHCAFKFPYDYYAVVKDGKTLRTSMTVQELSLKDGEGLEKRHYEGCPRWVKPMNDFKVEKVSNTKPCTFDDF